jgi:hypothetical protein
MANPIGPLSAGDELFNHQIIDTVAVVGTSDLAWTEKVCAQAMAKDGSLQLGFGLGKYTNRNVMDAYGGVSRGREQLAVRMSRRLSDDPQLLGGGPIRYEIVEPLKKIRFVLEPNDTQPIAFDWLFESVLEPMVEERTHNRSTFRVASELVRYHQIGTCSGWVEVDGIRTEMNPDTWVSTRDHSWGVRYDVGEPPTDMEPQRGLDGAQFQFFWSPILMERPDGSRYGLFFNVAKTVFPGFMQKSVTALIEETDGSVTHMADVEQDFTYDTSNRRLKGGNILATMSDGSARTFGVEVLGDTGFHLGAGLYFGWNGHHHGEWRGPLVVEGERIADCTTPENARLLHQIRDTTVRITDPVGGGVGYGNMQPIVVGAFPELGLDAESSFM